MLCHVLVWKYEKDFESIWSKNIWILWDIGARHFDKAYVLALGCCQVDNINYHQQFGWHPKQNMLQRWHSNAIWETSSQQTLTNSWKRGIWTPNFKNIQSSHSYTLNFYICLCFYLMIYFIHSSKIRITTFLLVVPTWKLQLCNRCYLKYVAINKIFFPHPCFVHHNLHLIMWVESLRGCSHILRN